MAEAFPGVKDQGGPPCARTRGIYSSVRVLGLDVGDRRIGLALSDETRTLATGLPTLERVGPKKDVKAVADLARRHEVGHIVVGLPRRLDGSIGPQAEKVREFTSRVRAAVSVPVVEWDERFTTVIAEQTLIEGGVRRSDRRKVVDKVAAVLILQNYLDAGSPGASTAG